MAEKLASLNKSGKGKLITGSITTTALSGWTRVKTISVDSGKRYLVCFGVTFSDGTSNVYRGVQIADLSQVGVIATGANVMATGIVSGVSEIYLNAYQGTGGTCTGTYQILEV